MTASSSPPLALGADPLAAVFERHYAEVYRYLARRVPRAVAEDLASETFAQAAARPGGFDPARGSARAWVFGTPPTCSRGTTATRCGPTGPGRGPGSTP